MIDIKRMISSDKTFEDIKKWSAKIEQVCANKTFCNALKESGLFDENMKNSNIKQKVLDDVNRFKLKFTENISKMLYDAVEETIILYRV